MSMYPILPLPYIFETLERSDIIMIIAFVFMFIAIVCLTGLCIWFHMRLKYLEECDIFVAFKEAELECIREKLCRVERKVKHLEDNFYEPYDD